GQISSFACGLLWCGRRGRGRCEVCFFQAEDGIRDSSVTGVQTCALPILPRLPGSEMLDRGLERPVVSKRAFWLDGETLEIPTFENAEGLVTRLTRRGILHRDELVERLVDGAGWAISTRSVQRHFMRALGMTPKTLQQILRARRAVQLLERGRPAVEVALQLGYADQPHLVRSLKRFM